MHIQQKEGMGSIDQVRKLYTMCCKDAADMLYLSMVKPRSNHKPTGGTNMARKLAPTDRQLEKVRMLAQAANDATTTEGMLDANFCGTCVYASCADCPVFTAYHGGRDMHERAGQELQIGW
jgi:hypothetical protein